MPESPSSVVDGKLHRDPREIALLRDAQIASDQLIVFYRESHDETRRLLDAAKATIASCYKNEHRLQSAIDEQQRATRQALEKARDDIKNASLLAFSFDTLLAEIDRRHRLAVSHGNS